MAESNLTDIQINKLIQDVQSAEQTVQQLKQSLANSGVLQKDLASGSANLGLNRFTDDIGADEGYKLSTFVNANAWAHNTKSLIEKSQDHDRSLKSIEIEKAKLELVRAQHDFAQKQKMDHYENMRSLAGLNKNCDLQEYE